MAQITIGVELVKWSEHGVSINIDNDELAKLIDFAAGGETRLTVVISHDDTPADDMPDCCKSGGRPCGNDYCRCMQ